MPPSKNDSETPKKNKPGRKPAGSEPNGPRALCLRCITEFVFPNHLDQECDRIYDSTSACTTCRSQRKKCVDVPVEFIPKMLNLRSLYDTWKNKKNSTVKKTAEKKLLSYAEDFKQQYKAAVQDETEEEEKPKPAKRKDIFADSAPKKLPLGVEYEAASIDLLVRMSNHMEELKELQESTCTSMNEELIPLLKEIKESIDVSTHLHVICRLLMPIANLLQKIPQAFEAAMARFRPAAPQMGTLNNTPTTAVSLL